MGSLTSKACTPCLLSSRTRGVFGVALRRLTVTFGAGAGTAFVAAPVGRRLFVARSAFDLLFSHDTGFFKLGGRFRRWRCILGVHGIHILKPFPHEGVRCNPAVILDSLDAGPKRHKPRDAEDPRLLPHKSLPATATLQLSVNMFGLKRECTRHTGIAAGAGAALFTGGAVRCDVGGRRACSTSSRSVTRAWSRAKITWCYSAGAPFGFSQLQALFAQ